MKVGDLVKWIGPLSEQYPGTRTAIVLDKWSNPQPKGPTHYWRVFMEGQVISMNEIYLEVIHESR